MSDSKFDIFIKDSIYPDSQTIFSFSLKSIQEIKDDCLFVLDTNVLLVPYHTGKKSLTQIKDIYLKLIGEKRLFIPEQVAREFATNRAEKLKEVYQQINRKVSQIGQLQVGQYPLLESLEIYQESINLEKEVNQLMTKYKNSLQNLLEHIRHWNWNDPVTLLYNEIFEKDILAGIGSFDQKTLESELERRIIHRIPPGYKDGGKDDSGIGDLLVWYTILNLGIEYEKDIIFVSNEGRKGDWRYRSDNVTLYPRHELVDEFRRHSNERSFQMIEFSNFLELFGAGENIIDEIKKEEDKTSASLRTFTFRPTWDDIEGILKSAGAQLMKFPNRQIVVEKNGRTLTYHRPKKNTRQVKESFLNEIESFLNKR